MQKTLAATLLIAFAHAAFGADVSPGLWEITMETRVPADTGFAPPPYKMTQCLTAEDARDPGKLFAQLSNRGATGCSYSDRNYAGNTFTFAMQCAGAFGLRTKGSVSFTPTTMDGNITGLASIGDKEVQTQNRVSARRLGSC